MVTHACDCHKVICYMVNEFLCSYIGTITLDMNSLTRQYTSACYDAYTVKTEV